MGDQRVVKVGRLGQAEQLLEEPLRGRGRPQILAPHDQRPARLGIVDNAREMVGGRRVLTSEDRIADVLALAVEAGAIVLGPARQTGETNRLLRIQPPAVGRIGPPLRIVWEAAAGAGIAAAGIAVWGRERLGDVGAGAEARIDEILRLEPFEGVRIAGRPLRLDDRLSVMGQPEPGQILENAADELRAAAARVEILDPEQESAAAGPRMGMAKRRRKGMAEVQASRRRGGETCDLQDSLHLKGDKGDS